MQSTVLSNVRSEMKVMCQEAFAPLVSIYEYESFDDAVRMVEDSPASLPPSDMTPMPPVFCQTLPESE